MEDNTDIMKKEKKKRKRREEKRENGKAKAVNSFQINKEVVNDYLIDWFCSELADRCTKQKQVRSKYLGRDMGEYGRLRIRGQALYKPRDICVQHFMFSSVSSSRN